jgi:hypothetical protein
MLKGEGDIRVHEDRDSAGGGDSEHIVRGRYADGIHIFDGEMVFVDRFRKTNPPANPQRCGKFADHHREPAVNQAKRDTAAEVTAPADQDVRKNIHDG